MPKLPNVKPKKIIKVLKKKGFIFDHATGSHHIFYKDKKTNPISVPLHNKDMKKGTLSAILKQSNISVKELIELL